MPRKDQLTPLDPTHFAQVPRSVLVHLRDIRRVTRGKHEAADIECRGRNESLLLSRSDLHCFKAKWTQSLAGSSCSPWVRAL